MFGYFVLFLVIAFLHKTLSPTTSDRRIVLSALLIVLVVKLCKCSFLEVSSEMFHFEVSDPPPNCCAGFNGKNITWDFLSDEVLFRDCGAPHAKQNGMCAAKYASLGSNGWTGDDNTVVGNSGGIGMLNSPVQGTGYSESVGCGVEGFCLPDSSCPSCHSDGTMMATMSTAWNGAGLFQPEKHRVQFENTDPAYGPLRGSDWGGLPHNKGYFGNLCD